MESELFGYVRKGPLLVHVKGERKDFLKRLMGAQYFWMKSVKVSLNLHAKLLRVLQEKEIVRVGGTKPLKLNTRVIVATNTNLERAIQEGVFR